MKQFNLIEYLKYPSTRKVVTRKGLDVEFLCTNAPGSYPIIAITEADKISFNCTVDGICFNNPLNDLFFDSRKREGWINIYTHDGKSYNAEHIFASKEEAEKTGSSRNTYITTIKIEWEE